MAQPPRKPPVPPVDHEPPPDPLPDAPHPEVARAGWGVAEFAARYGISEAKIAEEIALGHLGSVFVAGRRIILIEHEAAWLRAGQGKRRLTRRRPG
jgi:hypothetical protein